MKTTKRFVSANFNGEATKILPTVVLKRRLYSSKAMKSRPKFIGRLLKTLNFISKSNSNLENTPIFAILIY